ncbi:PAS domain-containing protein [Desulfobacter latus]|uniref:PAS domain-containing protein n=1 Tax=Desulfobacter latus TaxID=2292 RepID=UPI001FE79266|nr:PAS domain-containing protein [Desulfobacter latus]
MAAVNFTCDSHDPAVSKTCQIFGNPLHLTQFKEMYHSVFENTGTGTIIIDSDMLILYVNAKFMDLVGLERNEMENRRRDFDS